jgi:hypothetical protein
MKTDLITQFNLPNYIKGKTFAEASKLIGNKFKDRNDKASLDTKAALIKRLREAQEYIKSQTEPQQGEGANMDEINQASLGALLGQGAGSAGGAGAGAGAAAGETAGGMGEIGAGAAGGMAANADKAATATMAGPDVAGALELGTDLLSAGQDIFGKPDVDGSGLTRGDAVASRAGTTSGALSGGMDAIKGFATGDIMGGIGGLAKTAGALIGGNKELKAINKANHINTQMQSTNLRPYAKGGLIGDLGGGYKTDKLFEFDKADRSQFDTITSKSNPSNSAIIPDTTRGPMFNPPPSSAELNRSPLSVELEGSPEKTGTGKFIEGAGDLIKKHGANALQYAPVVGELFNKINRPTTERGTRIAGRTHLDRADEATSQNLINDQGVFEGVKAASAGNLGALMAGNLGGNLNKTRAKSGAYANDRAFNAGQQTKEVGMDRQADLANMAADDRYLERKAQDEGAYNTAKDNRRASIINSLGNIGKEEGNKKLVKEMFGYSWNGEYYTDAQGKKVEESEVASKLKNLNKGNTAMFGGYLKKK